MKKLFALLVICLSLVVYCGENLKDQPMTRENLEKLQKSKQLTVEEVGLLQTYMLREVFEQEGNIDTTITIGKAIDEQRQWVIEDSIRTVQEKRDAKDAFNKREAEIAKLREEVLVTLVNKRVEEAMFGDNFIITIAIKNNSIKTVKGIKGFLKLKDMFGDELVNLEIKHDEKIFSGNRIIRNMNYNFDLMSNKETLQKALIDDIDIKWEPEIIIFTDGTHLELAE